jgi:ADP-ribosylglycohydrolase
LAVAKAELINCLHHEETLFALNLAEKLAANSSEDAKNLACLGEGWIAEGALAIGVYCALRARNLEEGITMAVNISGDSDSTGSIAGNLLGAMYGVHEIPERWLKSLELRNVISEVADDLATWPKWPIHYWMAQSSGNANEIAEQQYWIDRYPAG